MKAFLSHLPSLMVATAWGTYRGSETIRAHVNSAAEREFASVIDKRMKDFHLIR